MRHRVGAQPAEHAAQRGRCGGLLPFGQGRDWGGEWDDRSGRRMRRVRIGLTLVPTQRRLEGGAVAVRLLQQDCQALERFGQAVDLLLELGRA
ncbi:MAG: hypothetical protein C4290_12360 [Chloroflexota bacterium]